MTIMVGHSKKNFQREEKKFWINEQLNKTLRKNPGLLLIQMLKNLKSLSKEKSYLDRISSKNITEPLDLQLANTEKWI